MIFNQVAPKIAILYRLFATHLSKYKIKSKESIREGSNTLKSNTNYQGIEIFVEHSNVLTTLNIIKH
jgi:hypothetical protein